jgi:hypothetical protein
LKAELDLKNSFYYYAGAFPSLQNNSLVLFYDDNLYQNMRIVCANLEIPYSSALIFMIQFTNDSHVNTFIKLFQSGNYSNLSLKSNSYGLMNQTKA